MTERDALIRAFIDKSDWAGARIAPLAGDASNRRYLRLRDPASGETAVLMDAPPNVARMSAPSSRSGAILAGSASAPRASLRPTWRRGCSCSKTLAMTFSPM